jgi:DNA invertase Pin-like site-specific DNA recombinase/peptidoglycan hydrolase-like protein with peptidoglycan-binding domain
MDRTYWMPGMRAGLGALVAILVLLVGTGTAVASGAPQGALPAKMADAAPLDLGSGFGAGREARQVKTLQRSLRQLGWAPGPVDGLFGPRTESAVRRFQAAGGLTPDGVAGQATWRVLGQALERPLSRGAGLATPNGSPRVRDLQLRLRRAGMRPGPVDGRYGPRTAAAVTRLERSRRTEARESRQAATRSKRAATRNALTRAAGGATALPLATADEEDNGGIDMPVALTIAALALMMGAVLGGSVVRARTRRNVRPAPEIAGPARTVIATQPPARGSVMASGPRAQVRVVGYVSIPKADRDRDSLDSQASAIEEFCRKRGWELLHVVRDVENGHPKGLERPGLQYALDRLAEGEASCLIVSELERLSRSAADLGQIVEWLVERDQRLVAIDVRLDTAVPSGQLTARTLMSVGEWESRRIGEQTRKGLAAARARRGRTGRPAVEDVPDLKRRIAAMREEGMTLQAIADSLNKDEVPTLRGGSQWRPSSVQAAAGYRRPKKVRPSLKPEPAEGGS